VWLYASLDGGASWSAPIEIASGVVDVKDAQLSPDGSAIELLGLNSVWQSAPVTGPPETRTVNLGDGTIFEAADGGLTHLPDGRSIVVSGTVTLLHFGWRVLGAGDPYQEASWSPWEASLIGTSVDADSGPSGTWVAREAGRVSVLRWNGHTFAGVGGQLGTASNRPIAIDVDLAGRVHVAWWPSTATCPRSCIAYRRRDSRGLGPAIFYPIPFTASTLLPLVVAANERGSGWIVWQDHGQAGDIRAVPLVSAPPFSRTGSRAIGQRRISIPVRRGCIRPGARFVHRLLVSGRRAGAQIVSVRFFFDADQLPRVDRKAPYRITYRLSFPPLSRHVAVARVAYRTSGHTHTTTVGRIIVMCPA
jgi:hypothetical protein